MEYFFSKSDVLSKKAVDGLEHTLEKFIATKKPTEHILPDLQYGIEYEHIRNIVSDSVEKLIGPHRSPGCFLQRSFKPLPIHSDWPNNQDADDDHEPYCAVLFPLRFDGPCSTVVFPETSKTKHLDENAQKKNHQYSTQEQKMLGHIRPEYLNRVSKPKSIKWNVGDAIVWRREHLHCSDNFPDYGTTFKDSLVLFTTKAK